MRRFIVLGVAAALAVGGVVTYLKYDAWFIYPAKRAHIIANLTDPDSANFRGERMTRTGWLCGEVNAKNRSGGYVGYKKFVSGSSSDAYLEGAGYVGDSPNSVLRVGDWLDRNAKHLMAANRLAEETGIRQTVSEVKSRIEVSIQNEIFEEQWTAHCVD